MNWLLLAGLIATLILTLFNLSLTAGLIKHLRERGSGGGHHPPAISLAKSGHNVGAFEARTAAGGAISQRDLARGDSLVAFVSMTCPPCQEVLAELASARPMPERRLFVFVLGDDADAATVAQRLPWAVVSQTDIDGPTTAAFGGVDGYPQLLLVSDAVITSAGTALADVTRAGAVPAHAGSSA
ncbi:hypothetical protein WEI85_21450 [Actinomycetes bacterium KLBMP 9797]